MDSAKKGNALDRAVPFGDVQSATSAIMASGALNSMIESSELTGLNTFALRGHVTRVACWPSLLVSYIGRHGRVSVLTLQYQIGEKRSALSLSDPVVGALPVQDECLSDVRFSIAASTFFGILQGQMPVFTLDEEGMAATKKRLIWPHDVTDVTKVPQPAAWSTKLKKALNDVLINNIPNGIHALTRGGCVREIEDKLPAEKVTAFMKWSISGPKAVRRLWQCVFGRVVAVCAHT